MVASSRQRVKEVMRKSLEGPLPQIEPVTSSEKRGEIVNKMLIK